MLCAPTGGAYLDHEAKSGRKEGKIDAAPYRCCLRPGCASDGELRCKL
jgi:hypothetical protein